MIDIAEDLKETVEKATAALLAISDEEAARRPAEGEWSPKEIVGHLIDSASNNHQRFVRARFREDLVFDGYDADAWVVLQRYQGRPWEFLVGLWKRFNLLLAAVIDAAPEEVRLRPRSEHNLHEIAWKKAPAGEPATLDYFMHDYVGHLKHHLRRIPISW